MIAIGQRMLWISQIQPRKLLNKSVNFVDSDDVAIDCYRCYMYQGITARDYTKNNHLVEIDVAYNNCENFGIISWQGIRTLSNKVLKFYATT